MQRSELEHVIRASGEIAGDTEIVIIGSQAILGQFPDAPGTLLVSMEADVYPLNRPEESDKVDGAIGEASPFHELHGYYAQGVGPETATLPDGWRARLVPINNANTNGVTGLCLEVHDLAISKLVAGRPKDLEFVEVLSRCELIDHRIMIERLSETALGVAERRNVTGRLKALARK